MLEINMHGDADVVWAWSFNGQIGIREVSKNEIYAVYLYLTDAQALQIVEKFAAHLGMQVVPLPKTAEPVEP